MCMWVPVAGKSLAWCIQYCTGHLNQQKLIKQLLKHQKHSTGSSDSKVSACNAGDLGLIPGSGRTLGGGHGNPLQYSCLENPMDRGAWWATVHGGPKES